MPQGAHWLFGSEYICLPEYVCLVIPLLSGLCCEAEHRLVLSLLTLLPFVGVLAWMLALPLRY